MAGPAYFDAFRRIVVQPDNITIAADAVDDTLTLVAGAGISLVASATSDQITIVNTNPAQFSLGVAGDDSSIKVINSGETIRFTGTQNVTVTADAEGAITITGPNLSSYLTAESDPIFTASAAAGITNTDISDWDTAYGWGNHSTAGYIINSDNIILSRLTVDGIIIDTNVIRGTDSNADLEITTNGTGSIRLNTNRVTIGSDAGATSQGSFAVAVGRQAGGNTQGGNAVAVGYQAGFISQGDNAVAIGRQAGYLGGQGVSAVAVGYAAAFTNQGDKAVAIGYGAGGTDQGLSAVSIGDLAGNLTQGNYAIAIGYSAGNTNQPANSIVINASGSTLDGSASGLYISPIRNINGGTFLTYDTINKEIGYTTNLDDITVGSIRINTNVIRTVDSNANLELSANGTGAVSVVDNFSVTGGSLTRSGNITSAFWGANGIALKLSPATYTDNTSSGTIVAQYAHSMGGPTLAFTNPTTVTTAATLYVSPVIAGSNATLTNNWAIFSNGSAQFTGSTGVSTPNMPAFRVYGSGTTNNLTTTQNTTGVLNSNNFAVDYNQGSHLNATTGVFTAPVAGLYQINVVARNSGFAGGVSQIAVTKNRATTNTIQVMVEWAASSTMNHTGGSSVTKLAVGDTLELQVLAGQINFDVNDNWSVAFLG